MTFIKNLFKCASEDVDRAVYINTHSHTHICSQILNILGVDAISHCLASMSVG